MIPFVVDMFGVAVSYAMLLMTYTSLSSVPNSSIGLRFISIMLSYLLMFFLIDYGVNIVVITVGFFTRPAFGTFVAWMGIVVLTGLLTRAYVSRPTRLNIDEMTNFIGASLRFDNYFRLRDVDTQEQIGKYKARKIYEDVHGAPFDESVIATPFDEMPTVFKRVGTGPAQQRPYRPAGYDEHHAALRAGTIPDLDESFTFEMRKYEKNRLLQHMSRFVLDPSTRTLSAVILLPEQMPDRIRLIERIYIALHHLLSIEWMPLYTPYFGRITISCKKLEMTENAVEAEIPLLTFSISVKDLQIRANRITTFSEIERIARISQEGNNDESHGIV